MNRLVAQVGNLLFRRLAVGRGRGLPIRDTADGQSALRGCSVSSGVQSAKFHLGECSLRRSAECSPVFVSVLLAHQWIDTSSAIHR